MNEQLDEQQERARAAREKLIGKEIAGRYVLRALVGHGGMGAVYEAEHLGLGKKVAIKFVDPEFATDERVVARFAREARAMSSIESAHIVTVFDAGTEEGRPYLVMELLRGEDLGQRLRRTRRVPLDESMHIIAQVLKGLAKAHAAGIVHRDLKPDNVFLVRSDTDPLFAKIVDFGVSKIERPRDKTSPLALTGRGTVLGTPFYMCPEQAQALPDVDARADIYSVGAILFECLSGRPPHTGETYEQIILSICMRDAPDLRAIDPSLPPPVAAFVGRALSRERTDRFASAERMLAALHELAPEEKKRVPLDTGAPETMMSPGVLFPSNNKAPPSQRSPISGDAPGVETRLVGAMSVGTSNAGAGAGATIVDPRPAGALAGLSDATSLSGSPNVAAAASPRASSPEQRVSANGARANAASSAGTLGDSAVLSAIGIPSARRRRSVTAVIITAALATLLGVGVMAAIIIVIGKKTSEGGGSSVTSTITSGGVPSAPTTTTTSASPAASPASSAAPPSSSAPAAAPAPTTPSSTKITPRTSNGGPAPKPTPTKLDISRDLP